MSTTTTLATARPLHPTLSASLHVPHRAHDGLTKKTMTAVPTASSRLTAIPGRNTASDGKSEDELVLTNKLDKSRSPYVRAHAGNPVAWQIWSPETLALAKKHDRVLFVSVGYAACHCMCAF